MLSIAAISARSAASYHLSLVNDDYYTKGGEPPGKWLGDGAKALGLTGTVEGEAFKALLKGFSPDGQPLVQNAGDPKHQAGWDNVFTTPKSVSASWALGTKEVRKEIEASHECAVGAAIEYMQDAAAFTRRGKGGKERESAKLVIAAFDHGTSRAQDPNLHTHAIVLNVAVRADGTTGTILSLPLFINKMVAGAIYRAELANQLEKRLGFVLERERTWFEVKGVPKSLVDEFSKRRKQVEEALAKLNASGAKAAAKLTLATRKAKEHVSRSELFARWQEVGERHGFTAEVVNKLLMKQGPRYDLADRAKTCIRAATQTITQRESHFPARELLRRAAEEAQTMGIPASVLRHVVKEELSRSKEFVSLGRVKGEIHYTTREMLAREKKLLEQVDKLKALPGTPLQRETIQLVEGGLSDQQKTALRHITQSRDLCQVISGLAGTGKSSMLKAARQAFESEGFQVIAACISGKAAQGLEESSGIRSSTLAKLIGMPEVGYRGELEKGLVDSVKDHARQMGRAALRKKTYPVESIRLSSNTVVVLDEAGMVPTWAMVRLTEHVLAAGARLVLLGDERQLQPIDAGGPFASIGQRLGRVTLTEIQRQREPWAREAVKSFAAGHGRDALVEYMRRGLVTVSEDRNEATQALISTWKREGLETPKDNLILASTNLEIAALNRMAQAERMLAGKLGRQGLSVSGADFFSGDRILFTRNSKRFAGVRNGTLGTVVGVDRVHRALTIKLDKGDRVIIPVKDYQHLMLGYALTTHRSQGVTTTNSWVLLGGPNQDRELTYVQASRARETTRFFIDKLEAGDELQELNRQIERSRQKDLAHDLLDRRGREYQESRNTLVQRIG